MFDFDLTPLFAVFVIVLLLIAAVSFGGGWWMRSPGKTAAPVSVTVMVDGEETLFFDGTNTRVGYHGADGGSSKTSVSTPLGVNSTFNFPGVVFKVVKDFKSNDVMVSLATKGK